MAVVKAETHHQEVTVEGSGTMGHLYHTLSPRLREHLKRGGGETVIAKAQGRWGEVSGLDLALVS